MIAIFAYCLIIDAIRLLPLPVQQPWEEDGGAIQNPGLNNGVLKARPEYLKVKAIRRDDGPPDEQHVNRFVNDMNGMNSYIFNQTAPICGWL